MKRILLFVSFLIGFSLNNFSQAPTNNSIENATLITSSNYVDENIRIDLSNPSTGGQSNCSVANFKSVYYKFTADVNATVTATIQDQFNAVLGNTFAIFYSAPDLNVTDESQLTSVSSCQFSSTSSFEMIEGQSYYLLVNRSETNKETKLNVTLPQKISVAERNILLELYNNTNGDSWTNNTNWNTDIESNWFGITVENGSVAKIILFNNNLTGNIPNSLKDLPLLKEVVLVTNKLTGTVPNLSTINTLETFSIARNNFVFEDLETHYNDNTTIPDFNYQVQNPIDEPLTINATIGNNYNLSMSEVSGTSVTYQWYKYRSNFDLENDILINGEVSSNLTITNTQEEDIDSYICYASSNIIPDLNIKRAVVKLRTPVSQSQRDALIAIYNATDGANWVSNENWLSSLHVDEWSGVTTTGNKVTYLNLNFKGLNGQLPEEIGNLIHLKELRISLNSNLTGNIPNTIGNLSELTFLRFQGNNMFGHIPESIVNLTKLRRLYLGGNSFSGEVPSGIANATGIIQIALDNNQFNGNLPNSFSSLNNLNLLSVSNNNFTGNLPDFTALNNLSTLSIQNNNYEFGNFENQFTTYNNGSIINFSYSPQKLVDEPKGYGISVGNSQILNSNVLGNQNNYQWFKDNVVISGATSASYNLTINSTSDYGTYHYTVTSNIVTGLTLQSHPIIINEPASNNQDYDALIALYNSTNGDNWINSWDLNAPISTWYGLTFDANNRVETLELNGNNLTGTLPIEVGDLINLKQFLVFGNDITGEVPNEIWTLTNLTHLWLGFQESRQLTLPNGIPSTISNLVHLEWLNLNRIPLTQPLQSELWNLPSLDKLRIQGCGLTGTLPPEFGGINDIHADNNEFEGTIPQEIINSSGNRNLGINFNYFDFTDLEPLVQANNYQTLNYSPQKTRDVTEEINASLGDDITLTVDDQGINRPAEVQKNAADNTYKWFKDNVEISGAITNTYTITNAQESNSGIYYCEIRNTLVPDLVIRRANIEVNLGTVLNTTDEILNNISIYPNPTNGIFTIKLNNELENATINLFDINGRQIIQRKLTSVKDEVDISNLSPGVYILSINSNKKQKIHRIVKQ